jgi:hypothetical protein
MSDKPNDLANDKPSVNPFDNEHHHKGDLAAGEHNEGTTNQNLNQSELTEQGNQTRGNTPGGNANETRHTQANKPRSNPQGNRPMSVDSDNSTKGPGSHGD